MADIPLCGIDEAGRGCIAGSLVIAGVVLTEVVEGLTDSKQLSERRREALYPEIIAKSRHHIVTFSAAQVDKLGISKCLRQGLQTIQKHLEGCRYLFDGNSTFGVSGIETMVKADAKIPEVSAASILAKVTRDRLIIEAAKHYPQYGFEKHKGYGTKAHIEAIVMHGRCEEHRHSFRIKAIDEPTLF